MITFIMIAPAVLSALNTNNQQVLTTCNNCICQYLQTETNKNGSPDVDSRRFRDEVEAVLREAIASFNIAVSKRLKVSFQPNEGGLSAVITFNASYAEAQTAYLH